MYTLKASLTYPDTKDTPVFYELPLNTKAELHAVEKSLVDALHKLVDLTANEMKTGKKAAIDTGNDPHTTFFEVNISKGTTDYGGYKFRWPNQAVEARAFLRGVMDGAMTQSGHAKHKRHA